MTSSTASSKALCPGCGEPYIPGEDVCGNCSFDLSTLGIPSPGSDFGAPLTEVRGPSPHKLAPTAPVSSAVAILRDDPASAVVVMEHGRVVGIFTERDILTKVAGRDEVLSQPMSTVMTADPVILRDTDTIATALNKMTVGGFRHIPLVHADELIGVVTSGDLMQWFMQKYID